MDDPRGMGHPPMAPSPDLVNTQEKESRRSHRAEESVPAGGSVMTFDAQGFLWITDTWTVTLGILGASGLLLWCHRALEREDAVSEAVAPARTDRVLPRRHGRAVPASALPGCPT